MLIVVFIFSVSKSVFARESSGISDTLVRISHKKSKDEQTGFIANYKGKPSVICDSKSFGQETVIKDSNGKELKFSEILIPAKEEKRKILIIILKEEEASRTMLEIDANFAKGDSISTKGYSLSTKKLYSGSGEITDIQDQKILISNKVRNDITGAPVFLSKTKKVIGLARCIKKKKMEMPYAERIDNIAKFATLNPDQVKKEEEALTNLEKSVIGYGKTYLKLQKTIEESDYKKDSSFKHLEPKQLKEVKEEIKELHDNLKKITKELSERLKEGKNRNEMVIPVFNSTFRANLIRAEEIIERKCKPREKELEKILDNLNKAF